MLNSFPFNSLVAIITVSSWFVVSEVMLYDTSFFFQSNDKRVQRTLMMNNSMKNKEINNTYIYIFVFPTIKITYYMNIIKYFLKF